jgi:hypothetical protein
MVLANGYVEGNPRITNPIDAILPRLKGIKNGISN